MKIESRRAISFSWADANRIAETVGKLDGLDETRKSTYSMVFILAAQPASDVVNCLPSKSLISVLGMEQFRLTKSLDQRKFTIGPCKNAAAYRTVVLADPEGREALRMLQMLLGDGPFDPDELVFHSRNGSALRETNVLHDCLHPALAALGLPKAGMHAFRHGCNRRWELAG